MSALDALLGPPARPAAPGANQRSLLLDQDVLIHLQELRRSECVALCSLPGRLPPQAWLGERGRCWSHAQRVSADHRAWSLLRLEPRSHRLLIGEIWPRAALDACTFGQRLDAHVEHHRRWRERLRALGAQGADR